MADGFIDVPIEHVTSSSGKTILLQPQQLQLRLKEVKREVVVTDVGVSLLQQELSADRAVREQQTGRAAADRLKARVAQGPVAVQEGGDNQMQQGETILSVRLESPLGVVALASIVENLGTGRMHVHLATCKAILQ